MSGGLITLPAQVRCRPRDERPIEAALERARARYRLSVVTAVAWSNACRNKHCSSDLYWEFDRQAKLLRAIKSREHFDDDAALFARHERLPIFDDRVHEVLDLPLVIVGRGVHFFKAT